MSAFPPPKTSPAPAGAPAPRRLTPRALRGALVAAFFAAFVLGGSPPARAINIWMNFQSGASGYPDYDPDGARLRELMGHVESYLEDIFEHASWTLEVQFYYLEFTDNTLAMHTSLATSQGKPTRCRIQVDMNRAWYFDPTPLNHDEFNMTQTLYRDLYPLDQTAYYGGSPNDLLEVSYNGTAKATAPEEARTGYDLFSVLAHEMGHGLGMTGSVASGEASGDIDYDFDSDLVWGGTTAAKAYAENNIYHLAALSAMYPYFGAGKRRLLSATDILAIQAAAQWSDAAIDLGRKDFYSPDATADFNLRGNWEGNKLPDAADDVWVRHGRTALLTAPGSASSLRIAAGSTVSTGGRVLTVAGTCAVGDGSTAGFLDVGAAGGTLHAATLDVKNGSQVTLNGGGRIHAGTVSLAGKTTLVGGGTVDVDTLLVNNGTLQTAGSAPLALVSTAGTGAIDLDGAGSDGNVLVHLADLAVGAPLADAFGGQMQVGPGRTATFAQGWELESDGRLELAGDGDLPASIAGGLFVAGGQINVVGDPCRLAADVRFTATAQVSLASASDVLHLDGAATFEGGSFTGAGHLVFDSTADVVIEDGVCIGANVIQRGWLALGSALGMATLEGDFAADEGALAIDLESVSSFDRLVILGAASLGGALEISLADGFVPTIGDSFEVLAFGSREGTFDAVVVHGGAALVPVYSATALTLWAAVPGDANTDGVVNEQDAALLAAHWLTAEGADWSQGDFNGDGRVDDLDLAVLAANWQQGLPSGASVPEPHLLTLLAGAIALVVFRTRSRFRP
ncbi:MAG: hypothetical protein JW809_11550 [Pirellulales bacterium]|nr:hypothetical protein [Pirellulales bacterium]